MTLEEKIKEAADNYFSGLKIMRSFMTKRTSFTDGANFMRELMQCEFCKNTGKHLCPDVVKAIEINCSKKGCVYGENQKLREQLAVVDSLLKELSDRHLWSQHCGECICQPHINVKNYLSKTQGGAE